MTPLKPSPPNKQIAVPLQLALAWHQQGRVQDALGMYQQVLGIDPRNFEALQGMGMLYGQLGRFEEALHYLGNAALSRPKDFSIHYNQGVALQELQRHEEALACYDRALKLKPDFAEGRINRGNALKELLRYAEALASYDQALLREPASAKAHNNRGAVLELLGRYDEALASYDQAIALNTGFARAHNNRGALLEKLRRYDEALAAYDRAIALSPDYAEANYNKGLLKLLLGDYEQGWLLYEWRWQTEQKDFVRHFSQSVWLGDRSLAGLRLLLHAEQGLGDTLQMVRYVPLLAALDCKLILEVPAALIPLLDTLKEKGHCTLVTQGDALPAFDLHCPLLSLPLAFKIRVDTIPAPIPYLSAAPQKQREWRERLGAKTRPRIGLAWSGNPLHKNDRNRSMALRTLEPLLQGDCEFHSLQNELRDEDRMSLAELARIRTHEEQLHDFADTAALIAELDLVISIDTAVAHLAGALGKVVWILLPYNADYRWLTVRSDSPWYPTARLFRQQQRDDWEGVIAEVSAELSRDGRRMDI